MVSSSLSPTVVKNGDRRAKSWNERSRVGRSSIAVSETLVVAPVRSGVISGCTWAVTVSSSSMAASWSEKLTAVASLRLTVTPSTVWGVKPSRVAVTVYGPPARTLRMFHRPFARLTVLYRVPVGSWTASMTTPGRAEPSSLATTLPVSEPVVAPWAWTTGARTRAALRTSSAQISARARDFMPVSP